MKCSKCYTMINALNKARTYWYGLQLDLRQATLFQKGLDLLINASDSISENKNIMNKSQITPTAPDPNPRGPESDGEPKSGSGG